MDGKRTQTTGRKFLSLTAAFVMGSWALAPAYASDTEVYAQQVDFSGETTPVLMMVLDSSGSMLECLENCPGGVDRITALRRAMKKVLFGEPQPTGTDSVVKPAPDYIKMGYSRFNPDANDGGWMRYPALKLSDSVPDAWTEKSSVDLSVRSGADDVSGTTVAGTTYSVGASMSSLGLRYSDLQIPRNATITGAMLHFTRSSTSAFPNSLKVAVDNVGNSLPLTSAGTAGRATWSSDVALGTDDGATTFYVNVTSLVQTVANRSDWCGGNALSFRVTSNGGSRTTSAWSYEGKPDLAPRLVVSYQISGAPRASSCIAMPLDIVLGVKDSLDDIEWPEGSPDSSVLFRSAVMYPAAVPDSVRQISALRFRKLQVPVGATIDKAWLYVTSSKTDAAAASAEVSAFDTSDVPEFCATDALTKRISCTIPNYSLTAPATLALPANPAGTGTDGRHLVVNVKDQVQAVVSRVGWYPGNNIGFRIAAPLSATTSSNSSIHTGDSARSKAAFLHIVARKVFTDLDKIDKTARQDLYDDISSRMYASGGTPLGDAYAEAARYMLGLAPYSTDTFTTTFDDQAPSQTYYQPDPRTVSSGKYASPLEDVSECSANYVYLMSDGEPNNASNINNNSNGITSGYNSACSAYSKVPKSTGNANANFACMMSVAKHLSSGKNQKKAVIRTNTVLFNQTLSGNVVTDMTTVSDDLYGKGQFFHAKTSSQLTDSLLETMTRMIDTDGSITAPGVAVNQFNRLEHLDQLYYAVFKPEGGAARWLGNVKRYRLAFEEIALDDGTMITNSFIEDAAELNAIDPKTKFFSASSRSFWRTKDEGADGADVAIGGAAGRLPLPAERKIYTFLDAYSSSPMDLALIDNVTDSAGMTAVGLTSTNQFINVRNWLKGYSIGIVTTAPKSIKTDVQAVSETTLLRNEMGGVLHSQPTLVNYGYTSSTAEQASANPDYQDNTVFFSTMEGMLHAVDANTGVEVFSFMPKETMARIDDIIINGTQDLPEFGLDASWTVYRVDGNKDGKISPNGAGGDKVWLFGGMRMGGRNYYALDVTNRSAPKLMWVKRGGVDTGFLKMGQTWSRPVLGDIKYNDQVKKVLFFAGGYDPKHEAAGYTGANSADAMGNQLYIVNPETGALIWSASNTGASLNSAALKFSVTAEPKLFDANRDGLVDAVYFGDLGGQVFRLDIQNGSGGASQIGKRLHKLASVGQGVVADTINQRRFYEAPSVAQVLDPLTNKPYVVVAMGSGYRSHPLDLETNDAFYVFKDGDVLRADLLTAVDSSLQDTIVPDDLPVLDLDSLLGVDLTDKMGWMLDLPGEGEKVLGSPLVLFGEVFFSSYLPKQNEESVGTACAPVIGTSNSWRMSVLDGKVLLDVNMDGVITEDDRSINDVVMGLGAAPQLVVGEDGRNSIIIGTGVVRNQDFNSAGMRPTRWYPKGGQ